MKFIAPEKISLNLNAKNIFTGLTILFLVVLFFQSFYSSFIAPKLFGVATELPARISVLNVHSHPLKGEDWNVHFTTSGRGDLTITPADKVTIDEDEFTSLFCGNEDRTKKVRILHGDALYYPDWNCSEVATVSHRTLATGKHHLYFQFARAKEIVIAEAFNASIAWDGGGLDANWNNGLNWVGDVAPGVNDLAVFDATACAANCNPTINVSISVQGINMTVAHTITQTNGTTVTIGLSGYTQSAGTFVGGDATSNMDINDAGFTLSGGNFTEPGGTMSIERNFTKSGAPVFTHNSGTILLDDVDSADDTIFDCGGITLNKVIITKDNTGDMTISSGCTVPLGADPTTVTNNALFVNNGTITIASGTWTHTDTNGNPNAGNILTNNGTITHSGNGWTFGMGFVNGVSGVVTYAGATTSFAGPLNVSQGTFPSGLGVNFTDDNSGDDTTLTCGSVTFNYVTITKDNTGDMVISSGCTVPLGASPTTVTNNAIFTNNGTITVSSGTWTHTDTNGNPNAGNILTNNGTITHSGNGWTFGMGFVNGASGVVTYAGATTSFAGPLNVSQGTFPSGLGVNFTDDNSGDDTTLTCGSVTFNYVTITKDNTGDMTISSGCTVPLGADPTTVTNNALFVNNGTITISSGTWTHTDTNGNPNAGNILTNNGTITHSGNGWTFGIGLVNGVSGVVTYAGATASFDGPLNVSQGTFPSGLTVTFTDDNFGDDTTLTCGSVTFTKVIITKDSSGDMIISSGCTVPLGASPTTVTNNGIFTNNGTITVSSGTWTHTDTNGNPNAGNILTNNGTTTHSGDGWVFGIGFVNGASGVVTYAGTTTSFAGPLNVSQGTFPNGLAVNFIDDNSGDSSTLTCGSVTFAQVTITKDSSGSMILGSSCTDTGDLTFAAGTLSNPGSAMTFIAQGNAAFNSAGTFGGANLTLSLEGGTSTTISKTAGTFASKLKINKTVGSSVTLTTALVTTNTFEVASGTFSQGATFALTTGGATTIGASGTWSNLGTGAVTLGGDVTNAGAIVLNANGSSCGDADSIVLSDAGVTQRTWSGAGSFTLQDLNVSDMAGAMTTQSSTNTANNTGWTFAACDQNPAAPASLGPASLVGGGWVNDNTPTFTFTVSDPDVADTLKHNIQIDDTSDFSSLLVDYTSALAAQGARTFTVGQAAGTGTYTAGSGGQTLSDSGVGYYWRVRAIDNLNAIGSFATATAGAIAFKLDTVSPVAGSLAIAPTSATSLTASISGASDVLSGLAATPYVFFNQTAGTNSGATAATSWLSPGLSPNTSYTFQASTTDLAGNSADTVTASLYTLANIPTSLSVAVNSNTQLTPSWSENSNPAGTEYEVINDTTGLVSGWTTATSTVFTNLACATSFSFRVKARNGNTTETAYTAATAQSTSACSGGGGSRDATPPTVSSFLPPSGATGVSTTTTLRMSMSEAVNKFSGNILIKRVSDNSTVEAVDVSGAQVTVSGSLVTITLMTPLQYVTNYYVEVSGGAFADTTGNAFPGFSGSATWSFTTGDGSTSVIPPAPEATTTPPDTIAPVVFVVSGSSTYTTGTVTFSTSESTRATIEWGLTSMYGAGTTSEAGYATDHTMIMIGLATSTRYYYRVSARDASNNQSIPYTGMFTTATPPLALPDTTPPANPGHFTGIPGETNIALSWSNPKDADLAAVRIMRQTSGYPTVPTDGVLVYEGLGTAADDAGLVEKTLYYYTAFARDEVPNYSSGAHFSKRTDKVTPPLPPHMPLPPVLPPQAPMPTPPVSLPGGGGQSILPPVVILPLATPTESTPRHEEAGTKEPLAPLRAFFSLSSSAIFSPATLKAMIDFSENMRKPIEDAAPLASGVGVAVGVSQAVILTTNVSSAYDLYLLLLKLFGLVTGLFRKKRSEPWGVVYDSVTKRPLDPAYVVAQVREGAESKGEAITDLDGRYGFLLDPGEYHIVANKTHYKFPSEKLKGSARDELYENLYFGEPFQVSEGGVVQYNIPLDPIEFDWNEFAKNHDKVFQVYSKRENIRRWIFNVIFYLGFLFSGATLILTPSLLNIGVVAIYVIILAFQIFWRRTHEITRVVDVATGKTLPFALIKVWYPNLNTIAKKVVTDELGRFYLLVPPGNYYVTVEAKQMDGSYKEVLKTAPEELRRGVLSGDLLV